MKPSSLLVIRHASGRHSTAMMVLLILPLLFALIQSVTSQVYVDSSSYHDNAKPTSPEPANQMLPIIGSSHPTARTEMPFKMDDKGLGDVAKTVMDKNISIVVMDKKDRISSGNPEEHTVRPSSSHSSTVSPATTVLMQPIGGHSENGVAEHPPKIKGSDHTVLLDRSLLAENEPETGKPISEASEEDSSASEVLIPTVINVEESAIDPVETIGDERAQYRPQAQTAYSILTTVYKAPINPSVSVVLQPKLSTTTLASGETTTKSADYPVAADGTGPRVTLSGADLGVGNHSKGSSHSPSPSSSPEGTMLLNTSKTSQQLKPLPPREVSTDPTNPAPSSTTPLGKVATTTNQQPSRVGSQGADNSTTTSKAPDIKILKPSNTSQQRPTDATSPQNTTLPLPIGRGRAIQIENGAKYVEKEFSVSLGNIPSIRLLPTPSTTHLSKDPCATGSGPCVAPKDPDVLSEFGTSNGSLLVWADLSRTLSFAWELHVFGSAALFLLLTAGATLGLALAPSMHCPHRGALALANGLLLLAGAVRATYFLLDPYGSRLLLPLPVITALYTLPLPLLLWVQAAMVVLVMKGAEVALLPPSFQRPPLLGILAVLQCTLLLAADLLSLALSPAVPVVLQSLTLTAGLVLCLGYLCMVLPRLSDPQAGRAGDKGLAGPKLRVLARVLAVCALLGALCCLLHAYTCLWLYGLLGDWRRFRWAWWLCQFWARLLELGWAFCLLLLASWVFWKPRGAQTGRGQGQGGAATSDLSSPCQSSTSSHTHTCWAKIVQSLKGRPHRKSDSNGVGGTSGGGVAGEVPNNWGGQERPGVDISKSLIRNRDPPKDSNRGRNQRGTAEGSAGSMLRLQALGSQPECSLRGSLDLDKESAVSLYDFDLRPPSPIDLGRSIDEALHREHLLKGGSLFRPLGPPSPPPSPQPWMRRNSDPQITLSESSDEHTLLSESSAALDRSIPSAVPSRQVTAPPTPTHQGPRWISEAPVPSSISCPVSLHPSPNSGRALTPSTDDTRPFLTPDLDKAELQVDNARGRGYLKVSRNDDSASVSSEIIDL